MSLKLTAALVVGLVIQLQVVFLPSTFFYLVSCNLIAYACDLVLNQRFKGTFTLISGELPLKWISLCPSNSGCLHLSHLWYLSASLSGDTALLHFCRYSLVLKNASWNNLGQLWGFLSLVYLLSWTKVLWFLLVSTWNVHTYIYVYIFFSTPSCKSSGGVIQNLLIPS